MPPAAPEKESSRMARFIVSYDLRNHRNYPPVWDLLKSLGAVRLLESLWVMNSTATAEQIRNAVRRVVDKDDGVVVIELTLPFPWATFNALSGGQAWLQR
jgi:hypothetical protein